MSIFKKLKGYILPETIDFFGELTKQSTSTKAIIYELQQFYSHKENSKPDQIFELILAAKQTRIKHLKELNKVFITPVDKEAISRAYIHLHWIVLSVKHLVIEMNTYQIYSLPEYDNLFTHLQIEIENLTTGFSLLNEKKFDEILKQVYTIIHHDNLLITEYATHLKELFNQKELKYILERKEVLTQIKEISKRTHICANQLEDIVFKMD